MSWETKRNAWLGWLLCTLLLSASCSPAPAPVPIAIPPAKPKLAPAALPAPGSLPATSAPDTVQAPASSDAPPQGTDEDEATRTDKTRSPAKRPLDSVAELDTAAAPATDAAPADRIMLLTPTGPLLIDVHITIQGENYRTSFEKLVETLTAIADDDQDGIVTWEGIMNHPRFRAGQFGNPATASYESQQEMIRLYDTTKNGRVDPDEQVRYLTSNQGTSRALAFYTSNSRRMRNRDESPIRTWLDTNDDLELDESEIAAAARRLRLRDRDDDEILVPNDFVDARDFPNRGLPAQRFRDSDYLPKVGWLISEDEPWSDMRVAWNHFYSAGQTLTAADLEMASELFGQLDLDENGSLDNIEMEMLAEVDAHIVIEAELATEDAASPASIKLQALRLSPDTIQAVVQHQPNRLTIQFPEALLDFFVTDNIGDMQYDEQAMNLLRQGDSDKNDYLTEDEFSAVAPFFNVEFATLDLDANEKIFQDEMITLLRQRNIIGRNQVSVRADDQTDALLPSLDLNSDGRIDSRELAEVSNSLLMLDRNEDGRIQLHELRGAMMLGIVRGGNRGPILQQDTTFAIPAVIREPSESAPRWFVGMDRNRDGGISWREFLGSRQQFDELDHDADGFVVPQEIAPP